MGLTLLRAGNILSITSLDVRIVIRQWTRLQAGRSWINTWPANNPMKDRGALSMAVTLHPMSKPALAPGQTKKSNAPFLQVYQKMAADSFSCHGMPMQH